MLSKNKVKILKSLQIKKFRREHKQFIIEGGKSVIEFLKSDFHIELVAGTPEFLETCRKSPEYRADEWIEATPEELSSLGTFQTNDAAIAVARMKPEIKVSVDKNEWVIALDEVRDPGNLGTIIRIADWYGVKKLICSVGTADCYNPKVISASMGSFTRVEISYTDLNAFLTTSPVPVYAAMLNGKDVHQMSGLKEGILLMGNESNGVSEALLQYAEKITIPSYGGAESLNVAIATAIIMDNFKR